MIGDLNVSILPFFEMFGQFEEGSAHLIFLGDPGRHEIGINDKLVAKVDAFDPEFPDDDGCEDSIDKFIVFTQKYNPFLKFLPFLWVLHH